MAIYNLPYTGPETAEYLAKARDMSGVPLDDGIYAGNKTYTAYDQYLNDNGALFKLNPSVALGYTINTSTYPLAKDDPNLIPYSNFESASTEAIEQFEQDGQDSIDNFENVTAPDAINDFIQQGNAAIQGAGWVNKGEFSTLPTMTDVNDVAVFEGNFWLPTEPLPYTATGSSPLTPPEQGKWVVAVTAELLGIARSLNALDSKVVYSTDTAATLDTVMFIYDAASQAVWKKPAGVQAGDTIVSIAGNQLTVTSGTYTLHYPDEVKSSYFGAFPSTSVDQSAALNAMFDFVRLAGNRFDIAPGTGPVIPLSIAIEPGVYLCESGVNATLLKFQGWSINADGVVIWSKAAGKAAFDLLGSRHGNTGQLMVVGDLVSTPRIGIQCGRYSDGVNSDNLSFTQCKTGGSFTLTAVYNFASETSAHYHCQYFNYHNGHDSYCEIIDGINMFDCQSDYLPQTVPIGTPQSCIQHLRSSHDLRKPLGGPTIAIVRTDQLDFINSYAVSVDDYTVRLFEDGNGMRDLNFNLHSEPGGSRLKGTFDFRKANEAPSGESTYTGFRYKEHIATSRLNIMTVATEVTKVNLLKVDIEIDDLEFGTNGPGNGLIGQPDRAEFVGRLSMPNELFRQALNFTGVIVTDDASLAPFGVGNYTVIDDTGRVIHKGDQVFKYNKDISVSAGKLTNGESQVVIRDGGIELTPLAVQLPLSAGVIATDDGTNWSGANATGSPRPVFYDGTGWIAMT